MSTLDEKKKLSEEKKRAQAKYKGRINNAETNPCLEEAEMSNKCLAANNYDSDKCKIYFENYKNCKKFWLEVVIDRRRKGIEPELPSIEEREKIKAERKQMLNN